MAHGTVAPRGGDVEATGGLTPPIAFGPVRSRRLGWSVGVNNIPAKTCSYACVYCQVGATDRARLDRAPFLDPGEIVAAVRTRLVECRAEGQAVDVVTFVPDGEPTLDAHLGEALRGVAALGPDVAVLTNGSLLWRDDVREDLIAASWVSIKVDTLDPATWTRLNRPIGGLRLDTVLDGVRRFAAEYRGDLVTETMLVAGMNDDDASLERTAAFVSALAPLRAYITLPTRPPTEPGVRAPSHETACRAAGIFHAAEIPVSCLLEDIEDPFTIIGDPTQALLGIVAVHPMLESSARDRLARSGADWSVAQALLDSGRITAVHHAGRTYLRGARGRDGRVRATGSEP